MKATLLFKLFHQTANLLLGVAALVAVVSELVGAPTLGMFANILITVCIMWTLAMQWRMSKRDLRMGRWDEQEYVLMSMLEAMERGMSQREWLDGYVEHSVADRMPSKS